MKADQERVSKLLTDTVTLLCKNGLVYGQEIKVQGLLGITLDKNDVFIVHINEVIGGSAIPATTTSATESVVRSRKSLSTAGNIAVVDLTRAVDTPAPQHNTLPPTSGLPSAPVGGTGRKQRLMPMQTMPPPPQLVAAQQMAAQRMTYSPRTAARMNSLQQQQQQQQQHHQQQQYNSRMAASYLAQLQHVSRGMMRLPPPLRHRAATAVAHRRPVINRPPPSQTLAPTLPAVDDDDEDVVIIGTGHEEPSPSWNSPSRRHPLPSRNTPTTATQSKPGRSDTSPVSRQHSHHIHRNTATTPTSAASIDINDDVIGDLELTAENIAPSPNDALMYGRALTTTTTTTTSVQHDDHVALATTTTATNATNATTVQQCNTVQNELRVGAETLDAVTAVSDTAQCDSLPVVDDTHNNTATDDSVVIDLQQPFVYTDIADVEELARNESLMEIEIPGFELLTSEEQLESSGATMMMWNCRAAGCLASYVEASHLANHYTVVHSVGLDLTPPPTVIVPTDTLSDTNIDTAATASSSTESYIELTCPFVTCDAKLSSYPGLLMHHKTIHGVPLPADERRAIIAAHRRLPRHTALIGTQQQQQQQQQQLQQQQPEQQVQSQGQSKNTFVCLVSDCGVVCPSRDELIEHIRTLHPAIVSSVDGQHKACKEENSD